MRIVHKTALVILLLIGDIALLGSCGESALALSSAGALA